MSISAAKEAITTSTSKERKRIAFCECKDGKNKLLVDDSTLENEEHVGGCNPTLPCARFVLDILEVRRMRKKSENSDDMPTLDAAMNVDQFFGL